MEKIQIELEGCETVSPNCREIREYLQAGDFNLSAPGLVTAFYQAKAREIKMEGLYYYGQDKVKAHLLVCPACEIWLTKVVPEEILKRQKRLAKYCCAGLFCAVEENEVRGYNRVSFSMERGEDPMWRFEKTPISYCPWCGGQLPNVPY